MLFEVRATNSASQLSTLHLEAANAADARRQALRMQLTPVSVQTQRQGLPTRRQRFNLPLFAEELQLLLSAGLSLVDAIEGLADRQEDVSTRTVFTSLADRLRNGERLSAALARQPDLFPALFVGIVRAAETTSSLPASLAKYVTYDAHSRLLRERLSSAAIYPALLLLVGLGVTVFLLAYVVPRFATVYQTGGRQLPWVSALLLESGAWLNQHLTQVAVVAAGLVLLVWAWFRQRPAGLSWIDLLSVVPAAARHLATVEVTRLYRTLAMLLEGGMPVREALVLADSVVAGKRRQDLVKALRQVEGGDPLSACLLNAGLCSPLALRLLQAGERSGRLGPMLERAAMFQEHETALWIERFSKVFGPALMILISLVVGVVVIFLYIPVFDLVGSLQ